MSSFCSGNVLLIKSSLKPPQPNTYNVVMKRTQFWAWDNYPLPPLFLKKDHSSLSLILPCLWFIIKPKYWTVFLCFESVSREHYVHCIDTFLKTCFLSSFFLFFSFHLFSFVLFSFFVFFFYGLFSSVSIYFSPCHFECNLTPLTRLLLCFRLSSPPFTYTCISFKNNNASQTIGIHLHHAQHHYNTIQYKIQSLLLSLYKV